MTRRYRICHRCDPGGVLTALGLVLAAGVAGMLSGVPAFVFGGAVLLTAGPVVVVRHHLRTGTVLALLPGLVTVDRWSLPWSTVSKVIVYEAPPGQPVLLGAQLRSPDHLPADVPAARLDQTTPATPVVLAAVAADRVDVNRLAAVFHRIGPAGVTLVRVAPRC